MEPGRRRHSCVPAAHRTYRRSSTRCGICTKTMINTKTRTKTKDLSQVFNQVWNVVSISIMVKIVYDDHHENYYSVFNLVYSRFEIDIEGATPKVKVFSNPRSL